MGSAHRLLRKHPIMFGFAEGVRLPRTISKQKIIVQPEGWTIILVEMMGVEPMSENLFPKLSTSVVYLLSFPQINADKQALILGSPLNRDRLQDSHLFTCTTKWRSYPGRGTPGKNGSWLKQLLKLFYYCQLFLKLRFLKRYRTSARL